MLDGFDRRAPNAIGGQSVIFGSRCGCSGRACRLCASSQKRIDIHPMVPSELQMPLHEPSTLIMKPSIAKVCVGVGLDSIDGHDRLLARGRTGQNAWLVEERHAASRWNEA